MTTATQADWRELALELANVAAELVTVAQAAAGERCRVDPLVRGMLHNNAASVSEMVERVREANQ